jgi:protrudin
MMPETLPESPHPPTKTPAFDLFNLVLSYKRLEIYLEPLKDAGDGVRYLLRYRLYGVVVACWAFCLPTL